MTRKWIGLLIAGGLLTADTVRYQYDDAGRLVSATYGNGAVVLYTYDKAGNLLSRNLAGAGPQISAGGVVNAASFKTPLVRGELASLFGSSLAAGVASAQSLPLPTQLGGVQVTVGGIAAPLYYVSPTQINFQAPFEAPITGSVPVVVIRDGVAGPAQPVAMAEYAPGVFTYPNGAGGVDPIIVHTTDQSLVTAANPAAAGEVLVVYATGAGSFDNPPASGAAASASPIASATVTPTVTVGGAAAQVLFAGLTPGVVGLLQINVVLPNSLPAGGTIQLVVAFGGSNSQPVNLYTH